MKPHSSRVVFPGAVLLFGLSACSDGGGGPRHLAGLPVGRDAEGLGGALGPGGANDAGGGLGGADGAPRNDAATTLDAERRADARVGPDDDALPTAMDGGGVGPSDVAEPPAPDAARSPMPDAGRPPVPDAAPPMPDAAPPTPDAAPPFERARGIDIFVDNFCNMEVRPPEIHVPPGEFVVLTWHNRSVDYAVDVWLSYGGGFLDLEPGTEWADRFEFCHGGERPYQAGADVSTACSEFRFVIYCE